MGLIRPGLLRATCSQPGIPGKPRSSLRHRLASRCTGWRSPSATVRAADPGHAVRLLGPQADDHRTYVISAVLLGWSALLFDAGALNATAQTIMWVVIFFFASAGASSAYLTVSETWPIEIRAEAIAVCFATAQVFGALGPAFYGALIGDGSSRTACTSGTWSAPPSCSSAASSSSSWASTPQASRWKPSPSHSPQRKQQPRPQLLPCSRCIRPGGPAGIPTCHIQRWASIRRLAGEGSREVPMAVHVAKRAGARARQSAVSAGDLVLAAKITAHASMTARSSR
jgi:hypothetical protein